MVRVVFWVVLLFQVVFRCGCFKLFALCKFSEVAYGSSIFSEKNFELRLSKVV